MSEVKVTDRGFEYIEFTDRHGEKCELQQSSLAEYEPPGTSAIWLGHAGEHRMHLDRRQVVWLLRKLILWLAFDSFKEPE